MHPVSAKFLTTLATSHRMVVEVDAYYDGALTAAGIPVADGSVTVDRGSKTRRTLSLTVADPSYLPWDASDMLASYGQYLVVRRGIRYSDGSTEMVPLGRFRISEPSGDTLYGPVTLSGHSSECLIIDDALTVPTSTRGYTGCVDAITALIRSTLPDSTIINATADERNPPCGVAVWDVGTDRWECVQKVATAMQAEVYVDALDRFVVADTPDVSTAPVAWNIAEGEGGALMASARTMSRTAVFNAVVASGEGGSGSTTISAMAKDLDPSSPTRWGGPFGKVTKSISSSLWTSEGACQSAADAALAEGLAANIQIAIDSVPNPALEGNDVLRIAYSGHAERFLLQSAQIPLTADGDFSVTLRSGKDDA
ncbi:DUF5047 domain-containing protein [Streptomyces sp. NBC_00239]|uniref:DUF5047 domain-containing protein n=1 Tax=Streptomyces sp. NBC_00239 TaxID=2903640 RepID=UPI002E2AF78C|nr:DUF5047 domain-containing protein [Streptomyces sp. NBC_00239]